MKRFLIFALLLISTFALAQTKDPVTSVVREILPRQQKNIVAAAEEMPAEKYGFKPTPGHMTFAHLMIHITESNTYLCAKIGDLPSPKPEELKDSDGKDKIVGALKASFDFCGTALSKVSDSQLGDSVELWGGRTAPRAFALIGLTNDWADHYGQEATYLRLEGLLPPTAHPNK